MPISTSRYSERRQTAILRPGAAVKHEERASGINIKYLRSLNGKSLMLLTTFWRTASGFGLLGKNGDTVDANVRLEKKLFGFGREILVK